MSNLDGVCDPRWAIWDKQDNKKDVVPKKRRKTLSFIYFSSLRFKPRGESVLQSLLLPSLGSTFKRLLMPFKSTKCAFLCLEWSLITLKSQTGRQKVYACVSLSAKELLN